MDESQGSDLLGDLTVFGFISLLLMMFFYPLYWFYKRGIKMEQEKIVNIYATHNKTGEIVELENIKKPLAKLIIRDLERCGNWDCEDHEILKD